MFVGRIDETEIIRTQLASDRERPDVASIVAVYGLFGAGKTTLLRRVRSIIEKEKLADALFVVNEDVTATSLPEFLYHLVSNFISLDAAVPRFFVDETEARRLRYLQIVGRIGADTMPLLGQLRSELHMRGSHPQGNARDVESEILALELAIKNQFNNADDQRLMLDTGNVLAESMIVDMMNTFYPLSDEIDSLTTYLERGKTPKKVVLVIDTYEKITPLLNPWLIESFLPYVYQKRFGDFQSYRTPYLPAGTFVRDFFDIRLVIAGRERLSLTDQERRWDRYRDRMEELYLGPFTRPELADYLQMNGFDPEADIERVLELTHGLPYLVALWVDAAHADADGAKHAFVTSLAEQRIFWYKTAEQREWIRAAAFLDWFDADALRCFPGVGERASQAFEYLRQCSEVARPSAAHPGKFELHGIIRAALREATFQESGELAEELRESASAFRDAFGVLSAFTPRERELIRRLAYFDRFDDYAVGVHFGGEAHLVRDLVAENPNLFLRRDPSMSLASDAAKVLRRYNRHAQRESYQRTVDELKLLWEKRRDQLQQEIDDRRGMIAEAEGKLRRMTSEQTMKSSLQNQTRASMGTIEADLQIARRKRRYSLSMRDSLVARTSFFFLVFFVLITVFADRLPLDPQTQSLIRTSALALSVLFLFVFALMLGRIFYMKSRRRELRDLREDVDSTEDRLRGKQFEYHSLAAEAETVGSEMAALKERIVGLRREIDERTARLAEPYV